MMRTIKLATLFALLLALTPVYAQRSDRAKRIGGRLWCMCGCNQILTQCNHVGCTTSTAMLKKLDALVERGDSDDLVIQAFVQEYGTQVQAQPPAEGFALMGYAMPGLALLTGLAIVLVIVQHWRRRAPEPAVADGPKVSSELLEQARRRADADTEDDWGGR